ncbi:MAG: metalloregulator ArsR/SmtB family transcription factor [Myxococcaceae bacterium]
MTRPLQDNDVFHAIAHPARRQILVLLRGHERAAGELAQPFAMTMGAVSQHLRVLQDAGLVEARRDGARRLYRLHTRPLAEVESWIGEFTEYFGERLDALGDYLDRTFGEPAAATSRPTRAKSAPWSPPSGSRSSRASRTRRGTRSPSRPAKSAPRR